MLTTHELFKMYGIATVVYILLSCFLWLPFFPVLVSIVQRAFLLFISRIYERLLARAMYDYHDMIHHDG